MPVKHAETLSVSIQKPFDKVYAYLAIPENYPHWASGLAKGLKKWGPVYMAETDDGMMKVKFSEKNDFGIADHFVYPTTDTEIYIPLRVLKNGEGSEVLLTLFQYPEMSAEKFAEDAEWVKKDLKALKDLLEKA
ncbi:MAG: SRPBCC family protein [Proteobacteria bacterium]|nr:MAG: SRPBCC family protein [Pseudomonadota bacterium]